MSNTVLIEFETVESSFNMLNCRVFISLIHIICSAMVQLCDGRYQPLPIVNAVDCTVTPACEPNSKFSPIDGSCANLKHPSWAQANTPFLRVQAAKYSGKDEPRKSVSGQALPSPRTISTSLFPDHPVPDPVNTLNLMQFRQVTAHDTLRMSLRNEEGKPSSSCCTSDNKPTQQPDGTCKAIEVDAKDRFYKQFIVQCLSVTRAKISDNKNCPKTETDQANGNTHTIDGSLIYGSDLATAQRLRVSGNNSLGKMRVQTTQDGRAFPPNNPNPTIPCDVRPNENVCYDTGDFRGNQNIGIVVYQIILVRLHNYLCDKLHKINPKWDDERLYQEARRIVGAMLQHITYKHFLPVILGKDFMKKKMINYHNGKEACVVYYNADINPGILNEFSGAAFRSFHSLIPRDVILADKDYKQVGKFNLDDFYFRPSMTQTAGTLDNLLRGLVSQAQETQDEYMSVTLTQFFNKRTKAFGSDVESIDIFRSLDLGLPSYNEMRVLCGLKKAKNFNDFAGEMSQESIKKLQKLYSSPNDIHLYVGGMMETLVPNTLVGPTFQCIIGEQFYNLQRGDHFYYENCGLPSSLTQAQRNAIYRTTLAWMFCKFGDNIQSVPFHTFLKISNDNPILPCKNIPAPDFSLWKE